jgi:hypothetical protein
MLDKGCLKWHVDLTRNQFIAWDQIFVILNDRYTRKHLYHNRPMHSSRT